MKAIAVALGLMAAAPGLRAEEIAPLRNLDLTLRTEGGAVAQLVAAQDLFALAVARHDPLAALAAARIMAGIGLSPVTRQPAEGQPVSQAMPPVTDAARMFDRARGLALDETLAALVEAERAGFSGPPQQTVGMSLGAVVPGAQDRWDLAFYAGNLAEIAVVGAGGGVLEIKVVDAGGQVICQQSGPRDRLYCPFVPRENGRFSVVIANPDAGPGAKAQSYALLTN